MSYPDRSRSGREEDRVIDLANEPDFDLGGMHVAPSTRELFGPSGREVLEPRVMMVLVVLAGHRGHTVSRDHLVELCWGGLIVGDDAINRVIGKLRKVAAASGAFEIETITKVGYLLKELPLDGAAAKVPAGAGAALAVEPVAPARKPEGGRTSILVALAAIAVAALGGAVWLWKPTRTAQPVAAVASGTSAEDPVVEALVKQGLIAIREHSAVQVQQGVAQLQEATAQDPDSARAWGALALGYSVLWHRTPPEEQPAVIARANAAIDRALELAPAQTEALQARAAMTPTFGNWLAREAIERDTVRRTGGRSGTYPRFLQFVGRNAAALPLIERAVAEDPGALYPMAGRANLMFALGRLDEADRATADLVRLWPRNYLAWFTRAYFLMYSNQADEAVRFIEDREKWPLEIPRAEMELVLQMARALASRSPAEADALIRTYDGLASKGQGYLQNAIRVSAALDRPDDAFRYAAILYLTPPDKLPRERFSGQQNYATGNDRHTDLLFMPPMDRLHGDPRFLDLLTRTGMVDYWKKSGTTPDFCARQQAACRAAGVSVTG